MSEVLELEEWKNKAVEFFGEDGTQWLFQCEFCKRVQSVKSIREQFDKGIPSKRFGFLRGEEQLYPEQCCYSPDCDYVSNGLFNGPILIVLNPKKVYDASLKKNCIYVMNFALNQSSTTSHPKGNCDDPTCPCSLMQSNQD